MKKIIGALIALYSAFAFSATTVPIQLLTAQAANTVIANATGSTASLTAFAMPSCSASGNNLQWTAGTGFTCATGYAQLASPTFTGTVTTAALTATGLITPSSTVGIKGTTAGDNANAGSVGEAISATQSSNVPLTNGVPANITSITLTAGDWDVYGMCSIIGSTSNQVNDVCGISTTSATLSSLGTFSQFQSSASAPIIAWLNPTPVVRINITGSTAVFLVGDSGFASGTANGTGLIFARRVR